MNLDEARRLHDRDEYYPDKCGTCGDANAGTLANWPCPTATALGATGRSEWLGVITFDNTVELRDTPEPAPLCAHGISYRDACNRCAQLAAGNTDANTNRNGYRAGNCDLTTDCTGLLDHTGPCTPYWAPCGLYATHNQGSHGPCIRDTTHDEGPHRDNNGNTW